MTTFKSTRGMAGAPSILHSYDEDGVLWFTFLNVNIAALKVSLRAHCVDIVNYRDSSVGLPYPRSINTTLFFHFESAAHTLIAALISLDAQSEERLSTALGALAFVQDIQRDQQEASS